MRPNDLARLRQSKPMPVIRFCHTHWAERTEQHTLYLRPERLASWVNSTTTGARRRLHRLVGAGDRYRLHCPATLSCWQATRRATPILRSQSRLVPCPRTLPRNRTRSYASSLRLALWASFMAWGLWDLPSGLVSCRSSDGVSYNCTEKSIAFFGNGPIGSSLLRILFSAFTLLLDGQRELVRPPNRTSR